MQNNIVFVMLGSFIVSFVTVEILRQVMLRAFWLFGLIGFVSMGTISYLLLSTTTYPLINIWVAILSCVFVFATLGYGVILYFEISEIIERLLTMRAADLACTCRVIDENTIEEYATCPIHGAKAQSR